ncbi:MAG: GGDEF domain-containing protein [gamma proteobacterium symbiont of Bathyaustriella thionipta]|nr:GGDEF domain-containing protein [gamma proteobacterium symbiont of Bathyaustriella thionipta]MCU7951277.1 GGDEF domain-containing protein [gamma proteobacterium symbiont of Bathyaustriella thionipta]MCU7952363.1 GGDEF domain-containing protein [gamma proteobacterium symbiont of Bathyaustriella thionipta]MCU7957807.1 GGDEF domain-containing protein [gamma proteobacterium symbiont of Bathyaustriella thionipta]MCU7968512.1 GGDEF domain-containing protein [gamma proteobacterium symbiont of Bathy
MKYLNNINFIESLARGTRHYDQKVIKQSLLEALNDFSFDADYELYRVYSTPLETTLSLLAVDKDNNIDIFKHGKDCDSFPVYLFSAISKAIESNTNSIINKPGTTEITHYIYPASDKKKDIYTVLIQTTAHKIEPENQRLVYGLLKLYSNYLHLIEKIKRDNLTNLLNRETLDTEITQILEQTSNNQLIFSKNSLSFTEQREKYEDYNYWLGVLDIDFFKNINDGYGHLYGDEVLIMVARLIEKNVRKFDLVFRYGGEEFVIILKSHDREVARLAFERIRKQIQAHSFGKIKQLTVSIGINQIIKQSGTSEIIGCADNALYFAKDNGRNQIQFYEELPEQKMAEADNRADNIEFL